jgi:Glycosyltransferase family 87
VTGGTAFELGWLSPRGRRQLTWTLAGAAVVLGLVGVLVLVSHLTTDPLSDVHAYYDAGSRLNAGAPLYPAGADTTSPEFYRYPPLLAILFRPLALLPYDVAAWFWEILTLATFGLTLWLLGLRSRRTWIAVGILGGPIAWSLSIGQAQATVTLLLTIGSPWSVALAAQLKLVPALVALYWIGRRDWTKLGWFAAWSAAFVVVQMLLEPAGSLAFLSGQNLDVSGLVNNLSPYAISPLLWVVFVIVLALVAVRMAPGRFGWASAVFVSVVASPRLFEYMFMTLLAALRKPGPGEAVVGETKSP